MRPIARDKEGPWVRDRAELLPGLRSLHVRRVRGDHGVKMPVHVVYYRVVRSGLVEIVRVLHERMDPGLHLAGEPTPAKTRRRKE